MGNWKEKFQLLTDDQRSQAESKLVSILSNHFLPKQLDLLLDAINDDKKKSFEDRVTEDFLKNSIILIDSNIILNLAKNRRDVPKIVDFFTGVHKGLLVASPQSFLEFWNNYGNIFEQVESLRNEFKNFENKVKKFDSTYTKLSDGIDALVKDFKEDYGHVISEDTQSNISLLIAYLKENAIIETIPRYKIKKYADIRKAHKHPPGFKDEGDGDFYIWSDFLYSLLLFSYLGQDVDRDSFMNHVIFLSDDVKIDWSLNGLIHPMLSAEIISAVGRDVDIIPMTSKRFKELLKKFNHL